ncbi:hypothetical protein ACFL0V_06755 [Nanoarchaeota archaeon]
MTTTMTIRLTHVGEPYGEGLYRPPTRDYGYRFEITGQNGQGWGRGFLTAYGHRIPERLAETIRECAERHKEQPVVILDTQFSVERGNIPNIADAVQEQLPDFDVRVASSLKPID